MHAADATNLRRPIYSFSCAYLHVVCFLMRTIRCALARKYIETQSLASTKRTSAGPHSARFSYVTSWACDARQANASPTRYIRVRACSSAHPRPAVMLTRRCSRNTHTQQMQTNVDNACRPRLSAAFQPSETSRDASCDDSYDASCDASRDASGKLPCIPAHRAAPQ